jgi:hypothetical protein
VALPKSSLYFNLIAKTKGEFESDMLQQRGPSRTYLQSTKIYCS